MTGYTQPESGGPILDVRGLSAGYGDILAIRDVSYHVNPGEIVAMFGANGAGKTTALLATVGEVPRTSGEVLWKGSLATSTLYKLARGGLSLVPEPPSVIARLTTLDNLRIGRGPVELALTYFPELEPLLNRRAGLLSGGEQQILAMGRALACRPDVLLVDELSLGLAPLIVERLTRALRTSADDTGLGVVLVEQQARRALAVADRWYLLRNGEIADEGQSNASVDDLEVAYLGSLTDSSRLPTARDADDGSSPVYAPGHRNRRRVRDARAGPGPGLPRVGPAQLLPGRHRDDRSVRLLRVHLRAHAAALGGSCHRARPLRGAGRPDTPAGAAADAPLVVPFAGHRHARRHHRAAGRGISALRPRPALRQVLAAHTHHPHLLEPAGHRLQRARNLRDTGERPSAGGRPRWPKSSASRPRWATRPTSSRA